MQLILVAAATLSLVIGESRTALVVYLITVMNAVVGLRQQGKAESAMNALKSMMQETAPGCGVTAPNRASRRRTSSSATSSCWRPATTSLPTAGSSRPPRCRSTSPP